MVGFFFSGFMLFGVLSPSTHQSQQYPTQNELEAVQRAGKDIRNERRPARRFVAVRLLSKSNHPQAITPLIHAIADSEFYIRRLAIQSLGRKGVARASKILSRRLADEPHFIVQRELLRALLQIRDRSVIPLIVRAYPRLHHAAKREAHRILQSLGLSKTKLP